MKYEVTNAIPSGTPRVLHDVNNRGVLVPSGEMRVVDLHDHDAARLKSAKRGTEVTLHAVEEPKQQQQSQPTNTAKK